MKVFTPKMHVTSYFLSARNKKKCVQKAFGRKIRKKCILPQKSTNFGSSLRPGDKICDNPGNRI